ncbi:MAG: hypothetical protein ACLFVB_03135 [Thermoplasmata archaeon]
MTKDLPHPNLLITAFIMFLLSWIFTNVEGFFFGDIFNLLEHLSQLIGAVLIAVWCWKIFIDKEGNNASHSDY